MGTIKAKFNLENLFRELGARVAPILTQAITEAFERSCLEVTTLAKSLDTYKDRTNNLRSSIGYVIYASGEKVSEYFSKAGAGAEGAGEEGIARGKEIANEAASSYPNDIVGVVVAGEYYALYVESKGYDVLTGPSQQLNAILEKNIRIVLDNIKQ